MTQVAAFRPGLCAGGVVPLRQFKALIGNGCELNSCLRNNAVLEEWLPTSMCRTELGRRLPGVHLLEMGWCFGRRRRPRGLVEQSRRDKFPSISQSEHVDGDWRLDAVRNECEDGSASSFADALDAAIKSLEQGSEQTAGEQRQAHDANVEVHETGENEFSESMENFEFNNVLEIALEVLEGEDYTSRDSGQDQLVDDEDEGCSGRTLEWILDNLVQYGSEDSSDFISDEEVQDLQL